MNEEIEKAFEEWDQKQGDGLCLAAKRNVLKEAFTAGARTERLLSMKRKVLKEIGEIVKCNPRDAEYGLTCPYEICEKIQKLKGKE